MNAPARLRPMPADRATTFQAWRVTQSAAYPARLAAPDTLDDAVAQALVGNCIQHKETLLVRVTPPTGPSHLHAFVVKQKSQPVWVRDDSTGVSKPIRPLYAAPIFSMAIDAFMPTLPFDALRDPAHGRDLSLVEG